MPPFAYSPFVNPYAQSIADTLARKGDPAARAAEIIGAANAHAAEVSGSAWAGVARNLGSDIQGVTQQIEQNRKEAPRRALEALQISGQRQQAQDDLLFRHAMSLVKGDDFAPAISFLDAQGPIGVGAKQKIQGVIETKQAKHNDDAAQLGFEIFKGGSTPDAVKKITDDAVKAGQLTPEQAQQWHVSSVENPDTIAADAKRLMAKSPRFSAYLEKPEQKVMEADPTKDIIDPATGQVIRKGTPKPLDTIDVARNTEIERHNKELERISSLNEGRQDAANKETARHNKAMEAAAAPFAGASASTSSAGPSGEDFLKTLSPQLASEVKAYATGRLPFPTGMSQAKLQPLIQAVTQYDPSFDAANYTARSKARTDLTSPSGVGGKTINALNTAIQHAGRLSDLIETLDNTEYPLANAVINPLRSAAGSTKVTNFNAVAPQLAKEIERAWRGAGGSTADIQELINSIGKNLGKQQQREALSQFVELAMGKLNATEQQRDNVMGPIASKDVPVLYDQSKPILEKITTRANGSTGTAPTFIEAIDDKGVVHHAPVGTPLPAGWKLK